MKSLIKNFLNLKLNKIYFNNKSLKRLNDGQPKNIYKEDQYNIVEQLLAFGERFNNALLLKNAQLHEHDPQLWAQEAPPLIQSVDTRAR